MPAVYVVNDHNSRFFDRYCCIIVIDIVILFASYNFDYNARLHSELVRDVISSSLVPAKYKNNNHWGAVAA